MGDLIDRDALMSRISSVARLAKNDAQKALLGMVIMIVLNTPTLDITVCDNCKYFTPDKNDAQRGECGLLAKKTWCDFFCGFGEKNDD